MDGVDDVDAAHALRPVSARFEFSRSYKRAGPQQPNFKVAEPLDKPWVALTVVAKPQESVTPARTLAKPEAVMRMDLESATLQSTVVVMSCVVPSTMSIVA